VSLEVTVAIVGATGAVGQEFLKLFEERSFPIKSLKLLASERSVGKSFLFRGRELPVELATEESVRGMDLVFFSAGAGRSRALIPAALQSGAIAVDNSSAFRMQADVPLVVPEVNPEALRTAGRLFPVANCTAIILTVAVGPLRKLGRIDRLIVSTYQSASGGGASMMRLLEDETKAIVAGEEPGPSILNTRYAFNLFSHNTPINEFGYNEEEAKVMEETRKILGMPELKINVTCVRVPVLRAHTESVTVEYAGKAPSEDEVREALAASPGVRVIDDRAANRFPTPLDASGQGDVLVGRIRRDISNPNAISMLIAGDQLLKGAALNAVQIAEHVLRLSHASVA
jgi:aspartate-semialdehyde dehydrogenase